MTTDKSTELTYPEAPELALARRLDEIAEANEDGYAMAGAMVIRRLHARVHELERELASIGAGGVEPLRSHGGMVPLNEVLARLRSCCGPNSAAEVALAHHFGARGAQGEGHAPAG